ncbi:MAG: peptide chain release factor N(5)-glutamine methyltransferase [Proteobacteria bacterium]|nr:peptide chain release factor N(5)-glutamine methyltransferase [Pseudomonadota bacterium]
MTSWTTGKVLDWAADDFRKRAFPSPRLEAEVLLTSVLGCRRLDLYTHFDRPLMDNELSAYREAISRRRSGEPTAYIVGKKEFWSLEFDVDPRVLIPRPETETLVEAALGRIPEDSLVLDLCTGSGCVAVALASERPGLSIDAVDISNDACEVAKQNVAKHGLSNRITVIAGDLFQPLSPGRRYDAIVANPPYIPKDEIGLLAPEVKKEPVGALAAGEDGLDVIRRILDQALSFLEPHGWIMMEVDPRQVDELLLHAATARFNADGEAICDLSGRKRIVVWQVA